MKKQISTFGGIPVMALGAMLLISQVAQAQNTVSINATNAGCVFTLRLPGMQTGAARSCAGDCLQVLGPGGVQFGPTANANFFQPQISAVAGCDPFPQVTVDYLDQGFGPLMPPPDGACILPSCRIAVSTVTAQAISGPKVTVTWTNQICVVSHLKVEFDKPYSDNVDDNLNPDYADTTGFLPCRKKQYSRKFKVGERILHQVDLRDCNGHQLTCSEMAGYSAYLSVAEYTTVGTSGNYSQSVLVTNIVGTVGDDDSGFLMARVCNPCNGSGDFKYTLNTTGFECGTAESKRFFRVVVKIIPNDGTDTVVAAEDVILESKRCKVNYHCSDDDD